MTRPNFLLLVLSCGMAAVGLAGLLVGFRTLLQPELKIQMHNTYFVLPPYWLVLALLLPLLLLALAGAVLRRHSPRLTSALLVAISLLLFGTDYLTQILTQLPALLGPPLLPAGVTNTSPDRWLLLAQVLHLTAIVGVGYGCYQLGRRVASR